MNAMLGGGVEQIEATQEGEHHYHHHKHKHKMEEVEGVPTMAQGLDVQEIGGGGFGGGGIGGGLLGGILAGALFGRDGFRRGDGGEGCVTPSQLSAALAGVQDTQMNTAVIQTLGAIQGAIPAAEGQVQLALAQAQGQLSNQIGQQSLAVAQGFGNTAQAISASQAAVIAVGESVKDAVNANGAANLLATKDAGAASLAAIAASTNQILTALKDQEITNLNRQLTVAELRNTEDRAEARARTTEVNVTQTVNQNQLQLQAQQQQQQQALLLATLCDRLNGLQNAVATNSNLIVGNTGATTTGAQTANPVNVRA